VTCDDGNLCTTGDSCQNGTCVGTEDESLAETLTECGASTNNDNKNTMWIILGTAAGLTSGAAIGAAVLIRRIRKSKLMDPDTWNPDAFSSIGANPLYKGSVKSVDNRLYEGHP